LTDLDPPYDTINDLKIGRLPNQHGIPFFYGQATIIYDQGKNELWHPTFTLLTYDGRDGDEGPQKPIPQRKQGYDRNQIPVVGVGPKELAKPNWGQPLYDKVRLCLSSGDEGTPTPSTR